MVRSNVADRDAEELWRAYMLLTDVEAAFRMQKSDLRLLMISTREPLEPEPPVADRLRKPFGG